MSPKSPRRYAPACAWRRLVFLLLVFTCLCCGQTAYAHASLLLAEPADNSLLKALPPQITLTFNEPVNPLVFRLARPDGTTLALDRISPVDNRIDIVLPEEKPPGTYGLSWRVISVDGHPVGGTLLLSVGARSATSAVDDAHRARSSAIWLVRLALYVGVFVAIGAALFHACFDPAHRAPRWPRRAAWLGLAAILPSLALLGLDAMDAPWTEILHPPIWQTALRTTYALTLGCAALALIASMACLQAATPGARRRFAAIATLLLCVGFAASGHASAAAPAWLARPAVALHTLAVTAWLGALIPLWRQMRNGTPRLEQVLAGFSRRIRVVVALLMVSGTLLAWLQVDRLASLWTTPYGQVLLCKSGLLACLFGLAAWNRYRLTARVMEGDPRARQRMAHVILAEILLAGCVLGVVALWRFTPPPRALHAERPATVSLHIHQATAMADITLRPAGQGQGGSMDLVLLDAAMAPLEPKEVHVSLSNAALGIEPVRRIATRLSPGLWRVGPLALPRADRWTVRIDALVSDFDEIALTADLRLTPANTDKNTR